MPKEDRIGWFVDMLVREAYCKASLALGELVPLYYVENNKLRIEFVSSENPLSSSAMKKSGMATKHLDGFTACASVQVAKYLIRVAKKAS